MVFARAVVVVLARAVVVVFARAVVVVFARAVVVVLARAVVVGRASWRTELDPHAARQTAGEITPRATKAKRRAAGTGAECSVTTVPNCAKCLGAPLIALAIPAK